MSLKSLLSLEVHRKDSEKNLATLRSLVYSSSDSSIVEQDSLLSILKDGFAVDDRMQLLSYYVSNMDLDPVPSLLEDPAFQDPDAVNMVDVANVLYEAGGDPENLSTAQKDLLAIYATKPETGAALAYATLIQLDERTDLPAVIVPDPSKSLLDNNWATPNGMDISLSVQPNPANDVLWLTYPLEMEGYEMSVVDMLGRQVFGSVLNSRGLFELSTRELPEGMYLTTVHRDGLTLGSLKFEVQH